MMLEIAFTLACNKNICMYERISVFAYFVIVRHQWEDIY